MAVTVCLDPTFCFGNTYYQVIFNIFQYYIHYSLLLLLVILPMTPLIAAMLLVDGIIAWSGTPPPQGSERCTIVEVDVEQSRLCYYCCLLHGLHLVHDVATCPYSRP